MSIVASSVLLATAFNQSMLITGRILMGVAVAISAVADCVYIAETAPAHVRGSMVTLNEVAITIGILVAYVASFTLNQWTVCTYIDRDNIYIHVYIYMLAHEYGRTILIILYRNESEIG